MLKAIARFFRMEKSRDDAFLRRIVMRYSRGNANLQLGRFLSSSDYERQKRRVLAYDFR